jgi:hypothetical protein
MRVVDVSPRNDWTAVRVWHEPTRQLGQSVYPTYGFVLPEGESPRGRIIEVANSGAEAGAQTAQAAKRFSVAPTGRSSRQDAATKPAPAKTKIINASLSGETAAPATSARTKTVTVTPRRKPNTTAVTAPKAAPAAKKEAVASAEKLRKQKPAKTDAGQVAEASR